MNDSGTKCFIVKAPVRLLRDSALGMRASGMFPYGVAESGPTLCGGKIQPSRQAASSSALSRSMLFASCRHRPTETTALQPFDVQPQPAPMRRGRPPAHRRVLAVELLAPVGGAQGQAGAGCGAEAAGRLDESPAGHHKDHAPRRQGGRACCGAVVLPTELLEAQPLLKYSSTSRLTSARLRPLGS